MKKIKCNSKIQKKKKKIKNLLNKPIKVMLTEPRKVKVKNQMKQNMIYFTNLKILKKYLKFKKKIFFQI